MTTGVVGTPCRVDADCPDMLNTTPFCFTDADGYPGGYCTAPCQVLCSDLSSVCVGGVFLVEGQCHAACMSNADCRTGYTCQEVQTLAGVSSACLPS